jgi:hypothetical protein
MPIQHLLAQIETFAAKRENRDVRPEWLTRFIDDVAQLFEPLCGLGRVGFDCQFTEDCWLVGIYLGSTEIVGGCHDGKTYFTNFTFDLRALIGKFAEISEFCWNALPETQSFDEAPDSHPPRDRSYLTIAGIVGGNRIRLNLFSVPPDGVGSALRQCADGAYEPV